MFVLGWGVNGEAWKWCRSLFVWEEEMVRECVERLSPIVLQVFLANRWVLKLHSSNYYIVSSVYNNFTAMDEASFMTFTLMVWIKVVPLKISIFPLRLILIRISTKDNLVR